MLERQQVLPITVEAAWQFFSTPTNLSRITPPELGLRIRDKDPSSSIHIGQRITYTVRPLFAFPVRWVTLITAVEAPYRFVDTQERGPYALWE
ncbi:MAG TPA: SRPBCC family protein, partial [Flavobacteriales bacterium]|nr:SRPBCC family protein [Flavobacteriales bacterium]